MLAYFNFDVKYLQPMFNHNHISLWQWHPNFGHIFEIFTIDNVSDHDLAILKNISDKTYDISQFALPEGNQSRLSVFIIVYSWYLL